MPSRSTRSLQDIVGKETYATWVNMLHLLVPGGRIHRLSVLIAGMLQYALVLAMKLDEDKLEEGSVASSLIASSKGGDKIKDELHDVMMRSRPGFSSYFSLFTSPFPHFQHNCHSIEQQRTSHISPLTEHYFRVSYKQQLCLSAL